ncbi:MULTISPECIES: hypothetical protein [unclassified Roseovarius]|uniref:hypothetical protein n=1 Tax=unclassified Roseovarius TaxID=2614913 RepID=UPI00273E8DB2|nr:MULTISPECIES: hypothetical protein [unclassified Roseovarius]
MRNFLMMGVVAAVLAGCGGGNSNSTPGRAVSTAPTPVASGPISNACLASDRTARSRKLCDCIQAVANQTLTGSEQRRAASFYSNPQQAQNIRQSDRAADEQFWKAYRAYGERSERVCRTG